MSIEGSFPWMSLPLELQTDVFEYLDLNSVRTLRLIGHPRLSAILRSIRTLRITLRGGDLKVPAHLSAYVRFASIFKTLTNLSFFGHIMVSYRPLSIFDLISSCPSLQSFHLETRWDLGEELFGDGYQDWVFGSQTACIAPPALHTLRVIGYQVKDLSTPPTPLPETLTELCILRTYSVLPIVLLPSLTSLTLGGCHDIMSSQIGSFPSSLIILKLRHSSKLTETSFPLLPRGLTRLTIGIASFTDESLAMLPPELVSLKISSFLKSDEFDSPEDRKPPITNQCLKYIPKSIRSVSFKTASFTLDALEHAPPNLQHVTVWKPYRGWLGVALSEDVSKLLANRPIPPTLLFTSFAELQPKVKKVTISLHKHVSVP